MIFFATKKGRPESFTRFDDEETTTTTTFSSTSTETATDALTIPTTTPGTIKKLQTVPDREWRHKHRHRHENLRSLKRDRHGNHMNSPNNTQVCQTIFFRSNISPQKISCNFRTTKSTKKDQSYGKRSPLI